ncbi:MAG: hypothetical protein K1X74_15270 [Pirellulales bacterium]|nr:hypothetical protein [Pirellulales bacterium]
MLTQGRSWLLDDPQDPVAVSRKFGTSATSEARVYSSFGKKFQAFDYDNSGNLTATPAVNTFGTGLASTFAFAGRQLDAGAGGKRTLTASRGRARQFRHGPWPARACRELPSTRTKPRADGPGLF